ncbi:MAG: ATP-binding protein [Candidatus Heteroscillospira sp.]
MIIRKLTARFGVLDGKSLSLSEGLNIITAPNESGKSTWCAFIRAMLYGIDTGRRSKAGSVSEKAACRPWSGAEPVGSMELELKSGLRLTLRRGTDSPSAPMRSFSAVYTGTENPYPLTGTEAGEALTGVSREVFARSAFTSQGGSRVENSPELEKRIAAIVSTGDEGLSYTEAEALLRKWQRERCYNARVGANAELEAELADIEARLDRLRGLHSQARSLQDELDEAERSMSFARRTPPQAITEAVREAEANARRAEAELEAAIAAGRAGCLLIPAGLIISAAVLPLLGAEPYWSLLPAAAALPFLVKHAAARRRLKEKRAAREAARSELEKRRRELDKSLSELENASPAMDALEEKRRRLAALEGKLSVLGDARELLSRREELHEAIEENRRQYESIELAREMLREAEQQHLEDFSPKLTRRASELFSRLTGARYEELAFDRGLNSAARLRGDALSRGSEHLSAGARELLYLCLRLALCELALPEDKNIPIILDDALCTLDDGRCAAFLELLLELSRSRQIILFTCHGREAAYLRHRPGVSTPEVTSI